nr:hypothetical protein MarFTME_012 [Marseillevirus futianmevirus]
MSSSTPMTGKERAKKFRENNRERSRELAREWYYRNREKAVAANAERRERAREEQKRKDRELEMLRNVVQTHGIQV